MFCFCVFDRINSLQARFRILKGPIVLQSEAAVDNTFMCCCMLHNMCLDFDGLASRYQEEENWMESLRITGAFSWEERDLGVDLSSVGLRGDHPLASSVESTGSIRSWNERQLALTTHIACLKKHRPLPWLKPAGQSHRQTYSPEVVASVLCDPS
jgi:hypothetical protein